MKIKALKKCMTPALGLSWESGEIKNVGEEQGKSLLTNPNFENAEVAKLSNNGEYLNREMKTRRRKSLNENE